MPPIRLVLTDLCVMLFIGAGIGRGLHPNIFWGATLGSAILCALGCVLALGLLGHAALSEFERAPPRYAQRLL